MMRILILGALVVGGLLNVSLSLAPAYPKKPCKPLIVDKELFISRKTDDYKISKVKIDGDCIKIGLSYLGGCGKADVNLVWDGRSKPGETPEVKLFATVDDQDECETRLAKNYSFDLNALRKFNEKGEILVRVVGVEGRFSYIAK